MSPEIVRRLQRLMRRGVQASHQPTAAALATSDARGHASVRMVLVKGIDARGAVWYTNTTSRKAAQLAMNPRAALCLYWPAAGKQAILEGAVAPVSEAEADAYWRTRDRRSQLGAWASLQSHRLPSRGMLLARVASSAVKFSGQPVPRPPHWSGYRLAPARIELWTAKPFRLNERVLYHRRNHRWTKTLLYP